MPSPPRTARSIPAGNYSFAGLDDRFFAFVLLPQDNTTTHVEIVKDDVAGAPAAKEEPHVGVQLGGDSVNRFAMFVGPKDVDLLRKVDPKLQQLIDWGWFGVIAKPIFLALHWLNDNLVHNYGWSIVAHHRHHQPLVAAAALLQHEIPEENAEAAAAESPPSTPNIKASACAIPRKPSRTRRSWSFTRRKAPIP